MVPSQQQNKQTYITMSSAQLKQPYVPQDNERPGMTMPFNRWGSSLGEQNCAGLQPPRRISTKEVKKGTPDIGGGRKALPDTNRLKSFRQASARRLGSNRNLTATRRNSLKKMDSIRNLESLRQASFRKLSAVDFTEISQASFNRSISLEDAMTSRADSCEGGPSWHNSVYSSCTESLHGPVSVIEFKEEQNFEHIEIEIAPGIFKRLVGSAETQEALANGKCVDAWCFVCETMLNVAPRCNSVICPHCRGISPVFKDDCDLGSIASANSWWITLDDDEAVGLGMAIEGV